VTVDLEPMLGRVAVAPPREQEIWGAVPGDFGGNMDAPEVRAGTTVYLPVFYEGAYFYFGDVHALQGDGEITGTGIETAADVTLRFDVVRGSTIAWPRFEDEEYLMVAGSVRPLMDAFRIAHTELVLWLESDYGFDRWEALQLLSQVGRARIANVVDPNYTVVAKFPKRYLPRD
jgi:acetamidase/formamidase